ncbi:MAG: carboxypeptidase-like regulatory domain-containing protein, partial [Tannerella sp.]|nr:carboxypeptidase-like regulatory domain-containing protein [Tannerella sp.]
MKISLFFLLVVSCCWANTSNSYAQKTEISLVKGNKTLQELFTEIEQKSEYIFLYNDNAINLSKKVTVDSRKRTLPEILDKVLEGSGVSYEIVDRQVIFYKTKEAPQAEAVSEALQQVNKKRITGTVVDTKGEAVIGANVVEKGVSNGTATDVNGKFTLDVSQGATLVVSYIGYIKQEIAVGNQANINVKLAEDTQAIEELVVVGYGTQKKRDLTGAISSVKMSDEPVGTFSTISHALAGKA